MCGGLRWFLVVCGGLWWFLVDCGGLSFSHTPFAYSRTRQVRYYRPLRGTWPFNALNSAVQNAN